MIILSLRIQACFTSSALRSQRKPFLLDQLIHLPQGLLTLCFILSDSFPRLLHHSLLKLILLLHVILSFLILSHCVLFGDYLSQVVFEGFFADHLRLELFKKVEAALDLFIFKVQTLLL